MGGRRTPWRRFVGKSFGMMGPKQTGPFFFTALWGPFSPERGKKKIIYIPGGRPEQFTPPRLSVESTGQIFNPRVARADLLAVFLDSAADYILLCR